MSTDQSFKNYLQSVKNPEIPTSESWQPVIFNLKAKEVQKFTSFSREHHIEIVDTIDEQMADYSKVKFPLEDNQYKRNQFIQEKYNNEGGKECSGNWIYLPWLKKVVHLLKKDAYFDVITNRNQYKITYDEQKELTKKKIGVVGLSVGAEAAITMAQEHLCGEIVIADFDYLDLSNLNRLNARFDEIGIPKTLITARRIIGINPYMKIEIYDKGVTEKNIHEFLNKVDLLVEECDDLALKYKIRKYAKSSKLNIIFAADERGMLSIEPYEYSPHLKEFHDIVTETPLTKNKHKTAFEFFYELTKWLGGWNNISERSRKSVENIGVNLCGYPQLAGEARLAAGQVSHVARQLLLGKKIPPYFGYLDLDELINPKK